MFQLVSVTCWFGSSSKLEVSADVPQHFHCSPWNLCFFIPHSSMPLTTTHCALHLRPISKSGSPHEREPLLDASFGVQQTLALGPVVYGSSATRHTILSSLSFLPTALSTFVLVGSFESHIYVHHIWEVFLVKTKNPNVFLGKMLC